MLGIVLFFTGWPPSLPRILNAPAQWLSAIEWWTTPSKMIRARVGPLRYAKLLLSSPVLMLVALVGGAIAILKRHLLGMVALGTGIFFFVLHSFVTKQPPRFVVYMIVPAQLLVGLTVEVALSDLTIAAERRGSAILVTALLITSAVGLPAQAVGMQPPSAYDRGDGWGLDENQSEVVATTLDIMQETDCDLHIAAPYDHNGAINHNVARWLYRNTGNNREGDIGYIADNRSSVTHGRWIPLENVTAHGDTPIILSLERHNVSYKTETQKQGKWVIMTPTSSCRE